MKLVFPALNRRFCESAAMRRVGRKLFRGFLGDASMASTTPFVEVSGVIGETLDTMGGTQDGTDVEVWDIEFTFISGRREPKAADDWLEEMVKLFDDANLNDANFTTVGMVRTDRTEPFIENGAFRAAIRYDLLIQRTFNLPAERHA